MPAELGRAAMCKSRACGCQSRPVFALSHLHEKRRRDSRQHVAAPASCKRRGTGSAHVTTTAGRENDRRSSFQKDRASEPRSDIDANVKPILEHRLSRDADESRHLRGVRSDYRVASMKKSGKRLEIAGENVQTISIDDDGAAPCKEHSFDKVSRFFGVAQTGANRNDVS